MFHGKCKTTALCKSARYVMASHKASWWCGSQRRANKDFPLCNPYSKRGGISGEGQKVHWISELVNQLMNDALECNK